MATVIELTAQLEALRNARASGVRSVEFTAGNGASRRVEYRSDDELQAAISDLEARLNPGRAHTILISTSKGI